MSMLTHFWPFCMYDKNLIKLDSRAQITFKHTTIKLLLSAVQKMDGANLRKWCKVLT